MHVRNVCTVSSQTYINIANIIFLHVWNCTNNYTESSLIKCYNKDCNSGEFEFELLNIGEGFLVLIHSSFELIIFLFGSIPQAKPWLGDFLVEIVKISSVNQIHVKILNTK